MSLYLKSEKRVDRCWSKLGHSLLLSAMMISSRVAVGIARLLLRHGCWLCGPRGRHWWKHVQVSWLVREEKCQAGQQRNRYSLRCPSCGKPSTHSIKKTANLSSKMAIMAGARRWRWWRERKWATKSQHLSDGTTFEYTWVLYINITGAERKRWPKSKAKAKSGRVTLGWNNVFRNRVARWLCRFKGEMYTMGEII